MCVDQQLSIKIGNASFFAACMVVFIHAPHRFLSHDIGSAIEYFLVEGVFRCAVPFFFVVSGFFLAHHFDEYGWYKREICKRCKSLLVPYFIWSLVFGFVFAVLTLSSNHARGLSLFNGFETFSLVKVFGLAPVVDPLSVQLWYLRFLFTAVLVSPIFWFFLRRGIGFCFLMLTLLFIGNCILPGSIPRSDTHTFFRHFFVFNGFFYIFLGMMIFRFAEKSSLRLTWNKCLACAICGLVLVLWNAITFYLGHENLLRQSIVSTCANLLFMIAFWTVVSDRQKTTCLNLSSLSFPIYLIHYSVVFFVSKIFTLIAGTSADLHLVRYIVTGTVSLILSFYVSRFLRLCVPGSKSILFGGR